MCGIVGLLIKKPEMRAQLGTLMLPMLIGMTERGPDSAGMAVYGTSAGAGRRKFSLYAADTSHAWADVESAARQAFEGDVTFTAIANHAVLESTAPTDAVKAWLDSMFPSLHLLAVGQSIDLYKDVGAPAEIAERYDFAHLTGSHVVGHTRMATESAVTPAHAHPFTAGEDFCLVHNGSLSNPGSVRRSLQRSGVHFDTDNDTEAACRFIAHRMDQGDSLEQALRHGFDELDGFYTFLMGTRDELAIVRDAFSCKPAIVAETDDYVAISSEFRSLAKLPGIRHANLFEPKPEEIYAWRV
jgi:methylamine---glutamate N-methyltransferase subunit A